MPEVIASDDENNPLGEMKARDKNEFVVNASVHEITEFIVGTLIDSDYNKIASDVEEISKPLSSVEDQCECGSETIS